MIIAERGYYPKETFRLKGSNEKINFLFLIGNGGQ